MTVRVGLALIAALSLIVVAIVTGVACADESFAGTQAPPYVPMGGDMPDGVVAQVFLTPRKAAIKVPVVLTMSLRNLNEYPVTIWPPGSPDGEVSILVFDGGGEPVGLTKFGRENWWKNVSVPGEVIQIGSGCAIGVKVPLDKYFNLSRWGAYTAVMTHRSTLDLPHDRLFSPIDFAYYTKETVASCAPGQKFADEDSLNRWVAAHLAGDEALTGPVVPSSAFDDGKSFDAQWEQALRSPGISRGGLALAAQISPVDRRGTLLVVSLTNIGINAAPTQRWVWSRASPTTAYFGTAKDQYGLEDAVTVERGFRASDYRILVRDASGKPARLKKGARAWLAERESTWNRVINTLGPSDSQKATHVARGLRPGEAVGLAFPLQDLFEIEPNEDYTAIAVLPGKTPADPAWVSPLVRFYVPEPEAPGVNRPDYGSSRIWDRLVARAMERHAEVSAESIVRVDENGAAHLEIRAENRTRHPLPDAFMGSEFVLIRDSRGNPVLKNWGLFRPNVTSLGYNKDAPSPDKRIAYADIHLSLAYHFTSGEQYTLLSAINLTHRPESGLPDTPLVAKPVSFRIPEQGSRQTTAQEEQRFEPTETNTAHRALRSSFDDNWRLQMRFGGIPFDGLRLDASVADLTHVKVHLRNCGNRPIVVAKWEGNSDYEFLVRDPKGRPVVASAKGKKFFESGTHLKLQELRPGEAVGATLPLTEFFDMAAPGEYTVLVSLPVVGDVDAVMTASPVKVRIEQNWVDRTK